MGKIEPLAWVQQSPIQALIAAVILLVFCALLVAFMRQRRQQRRLASIKIQLASLRRDIRRLEAAHEGLLVRLMNLPRSHEVSIASGSSSDTVDEKPKVPELYLVAPKTSPE
jgi:hypothetical protein